MPAEMSPAQKQKLIEQVAVAQVLGTVGKGRTIYLGKTDVEKLNEGVTLEIDASDPAKIALTVVDAPE